MSGTIEVTFPDGSKKSYPVGITPLGIAQSIGPRLARDALVAKVNDVLVDLTTPLTASCDLKILTFEDPHGKETYRHSTAHIFAYAIQQLYPKAKNTIGPAVEEGFYYDFDDLAITPEDFPKIEEKMAEIIKQNLPFKRTVLTLDDVKRIFPHNPYKLELAQEFAANGELLTAYQLGDQFIDLCTGPHVPTSGSIGVIKLLKCAGAYWRANANNKQLTRVYGISFRNAKELKEHLDLVALAEARDHKKIGKELDLYMLHDLVGKGLPIWLPKGQIIKYEIEKYAMEMERKAGFVRVSTPALAKQELFMKSGHLPHYAESMYPKMVMDDGTYYLKAMNCPIHHLIFGHHTRSYRELPLRIAEYGTVYRNELSGTLAGLSRVRMLCQNDAHIYCTKDQVAGEIKAVLEMIKEYFRVFQFKNYYFRLSCWDPANKEKYIDEPDNWEMAETALRAILKEIGIQYVEAKNEAAFYGPKIDIQFKNVYGKEDTLSTVQLDFAAKKRFELSYMDNDGKVNNEVFVIHRAPLSTHERFVAFLIEEYGGKFPLWLSPVQVKLLTVADRFGPYANAVNEKLLEWGIRSEVDIRAESVSKKVREAQLEQINYIVVIGEQEQAKESVTVRTRAGQILGEMPINDFVGKLMQEIRKKE